MDSTSNSPITYRTCNVRFGPPPPGVEFNAEPVIYRPKFSLLGFRTDALPCGRAFFAALQAQRGIVNGTSGASNGKSGKGKDGESKEDFAINIPTNITAQNLDQFSLYDVLGLGNNVGADIETIRKCYHKAVLLYHPDKKIDKAENGEEDRTIFLKVQLAFNTLTNEDKRRAYDSQLDFDDSVPDSDEVAQALSKGPQAFCDLFRPVFERNARFASVKPVPSFGDENTPIADVNRFYSYWVKFDSWRDFTDVDGEHRPDEATSREEKRWMIKENAVISRKLKKKEIARVNDLVMSALENDPRVLKDKEVQKRAKEEAKLAREAEQRRIAEKEAAAKRKEEEDLVKEKELAKLAKEEKDRLKKLHGKYRSIFRRIMRAISFTNGGSSSSEYGDFEYEDVELICQNTPPEELCSVNDCLGGESSLEAHASGAGVFTHTDVSSAQVVSGLQRVRDLIARLKAEAIAEKQKEEEVKKAFRQEQLRLNAEAERKAKGLGREWTKDELSMLSKCLIRFPAGSGARWEAICNYMNSVMKPTLPYEKAECMRYAQNSIQFFASKIKDGKKDDAIAESAAPTATVPVVVSATTAPPAAVASVTVEAVKAPPIPVVDARSNDTNLPKAPIAVTRVQSQIPPPVNAPVTIAQVSSDSLTAWTPEQQKMLEAGIRKYPTTAVADAKERWKLISAEVPGKTQAECVARYKYLAEQVKAKQQANKTAK